MPECSSSQAGRGNLRVMKFGGTSVGDADALARAASIIISAGREHPVLAVVSAISGVTDTLVEAAARAASGDSDAGTMLADHLQCRHSRLAHALIGDEDRRRELQGEIRLLANAAGRLCDRLADERRLSPQLCDAIYSTGERIAARLLAAILCDRGALSVAVDASTLIVTDASHGAAEPDMRATRVRARLHLLPLVAAGVVPVVTGFIGATEEGVTTTLGRGGSDYSATVLGAALDAAEVIIWTDVDGVMTADPRRSPEARTIPRLSYAAATAMAEAGAKVLHPRTLRPVETRAIPVRVRNSFAPASLGTLITATAASSADLI